eukprot:3937232-Rhodomonas_salina.1
MQCGFERREGSSGGGGGDEKTTFTAREVVERVKAFLSNTTAKTNSVTGAVEGGMHTLATIKEMQYEGPPIRFAGSENEPVYPPGENARVAYMRLKDLTFAEDIKNWRGDGEDGCKESMPSITQNDASLCTFANEYDAIDHYDADMSYRKKAAENLRCQDNTPPLAAYKECSEEANVKRDKLREWVETYWRKDQGTWLPVLDARSGVKWAVDRHAAGLGFTVMFASAFRSGQQRHVGRVLGKRVCVDNSRKYGICAVSKDKTMHIVNPWLGGEFSI